MTHTCNSDIDSLGGCDCGVKDETITVCAYCYKIIPRQRATGHKIIDGIKIKRTGWKGGKQFCGSVCRKTYTADKEASEQLLNNEYIYTIGVK